MNNPQTSLSSNVAPLFNSQPINDICTTIDKKVEEGKEYKEEKETLLFLISNSVDLSHPAKSFEPYRKAFDFAKSY